MFFLFGREPLLGQNSIPPPKLTTGMLLVIMRRSRCVYAATQRRMLLPMRFSYARQLRSLLDVHRSHLLAVGIALTFG